MSSQNRSLAPQTARHDADVVVFLVGMRINAWWAIHEWLPIVLAMPRMIRELEADPESGFLGYEQALGNPTIMVQCWRSTEHLLRYARGSGTVHHAAWKAFNQKVARSKRVGLWHETFAVPRGQAESVYVNMPQFGLGKVDGTEAAVGHRRSFRGRMEAPAPSPALTVDPPRSCPHAALTVDPPRGCPHRAPSEPLASPRAKGRR